jgi:predicted transcriptional regulator
MLTKRSFNRREYRFCHPPLSIADAMLPSFEIFLLSYYRHISGITVSRSNLGMTKSVHVIKADDALHVILSVMVETNISRIVVVRDRQPIGIITTCDLVRISSIADPYFDRYSQLEEQQQKVSMILLRLFLVYP